MRRTSRGEPITMDRLAARSRGRSARLKVPHRAGLERAREIKEAFDAFDVGAVGEVGYHDLTVAMSTLGLRLDKAEVHAAMDRLGCLETGRLHFDAFSEILQQSFSEQDPLETMLQSFRLFDRGNRGRISRQDLRRIAGDLGEELTDAELRDMIDLFDGNQDGEIDEAEFVRVMAGTSLH
mmetsp:Transcript_52926/g.139712  ORF Transcript_52926/g.139712 Transcript_52926/m.139712 type:complete len:180 (-) Transcript_52926:41-580(-)